MDRLTVFQDLLDSLPSGPRLEPDFSPAEKILQNHLDAARVRYLPAADWRSHPARRRLSRGDMWETGPAGGEWRLAVPVMVEGRLLGALALGAKRRGVPYSRDEKAFLSLVSFFLREALARQALWKSVENLNRQAAVGFLAGTLAHEIRNPLTALQTLLQLFPMKSGDPRFLADFHKILAGQMGRLQYLAENYLSWLAATPGAQEAAELACAAQRVSGLLAPLFKGKAAVISLKPGPPVWARVGPFQLESLLLNLVQNAYQALPPKGGRVEISSRAGVRAPGRPGLWVELAVKDNGRGIRRADLERIFDPFFTSRDGGRGLGLAICRRVVEGAGGFLTARSSSKGTQFSAYFSGVSKP